MKRFLVCLALLFTTSGVFAQPSPDRLRELEARIEELEKRIAALASSSDPRTREALQEIRRQIDALTREIERLKSGVPEKAPRAGTTGAQGLGPAASKVYKLERGVSIGGYGEALYQNFNKNREDGAPSGKTDTIDLLRAVFYFGYKFNDRILFNSELEFEHATTGEGAEEKGEVALEFAYLDLRCRKELQARAGLLLVPVGFLNELHEPPIFLGARRPEVEQRILPSTWRELGLGVFGEAGPFNYRVYLVNGLDAAGFSASSGIRGGRQGGSRALAEDFAFTGRLDYVGAAGLLLGLSGFSGNSAHGRRGVEGESFDGRVSLLDAHAEWRWKGLQIRALAVRGWIGDAARINQFNDLFGKASVGSRFFGTYAEAGYDVLSGRPREASLVPFARYERFNTQDRVPTGFASDPSNDVRVWTVGANYRPIPQVVAKVDYQNFHNRARTGTYQWNVALGYLF